MDGEARRGTRIPVRRAAARELCSFSPGTDRDVAERVQVREGRTERAGVR